MALKNLKSGVFDQYEVLAASGTVVFPEQGTKTVFITKGTAAAVTLTAPTAGTHDNCRIVFVATTAAAHTVTATTIGFNAGNTTTDVGTFGGAIGDGFEAIAYNGEVYTANVVNVTFA